MAKRVFISYSHKQVDWVRETLYPVLSAGGAEITIDYKEFAAGIAVRKQMHEAQTRADVHLLVFTPDYLKSVYCREEMQRAFAADVGFENGAVLPILLQSCELPPELTAAQPLYVDLSGNRQRDSEAWHRVLKRCDADLGTAVPDWLRAFDVMRKALEDRRSVNLTINGKGVRWRELLAQLKLVIPRMGIVDLQSGRTATRRLMVEWILQECASYQAKLPKDDLAELERVLIAQGHSCLALTHFDLIKEKKDGNFDVNFFSCLRYLIMDLRKLTLLVGSDTPFAALLPSNHKLSELSMETVELGGKR